MNIPTALMIFICLLSLVFHIPISASADLKQDFLHLHNKLREEAGAEPLEWDDKLESYARDYAHKRSSDCQQKHSKGPYGENIYWGYGDGFTDPNAALTWWLKEKIHFHPDTGECTEGTLCSNYKQVVYPKTRHLGCARVRCGDGSSTLIICNYEPRAA